MVAMALARMHVHVAILVDNAIVLRGRIMRNVKRIVLVLFPMNIFRLSLIDLHITLLCELGLVGHLVLV